MEAKIPHKNQSRTDIDQQETQKAVDNFLVDNFFETWDSEGFGQNDGSAPYYTTNHRIFAKKLLYQLPASYKSLDSGLPWLSYWITNILEMTNKGNSLSYEEKLKFVPFLKELHSFDGGFQGLSKGLSHWVSSYAAVMCIVNLGIKEAYDVIDIPKMREFLMRMKNSNLENKSPSAFTDKNGNYLITRIEDNNCSTSNSTFPGAFSGHLNGESDLRSTYCAWTIAYILNILDDQWTEGVFENIQKCQTFEGGFGPEPFCEAHGGYSFCAIASLIWLNKLDKIDMDGFIRWLVNRQMTVEGGFNGRTNKWVDSCYSFWQGSVFNMLIDADKKYSENNEWLYDQLSLQAYIWFCCQNPGGGWKDKPGKNQDLFHTNYATAGWICSQYTLWGEVKVLARDWETFKQWNPIFCVNDDNVKKAREYYSSLNK